MALISLVEYAKRNGRSEVTVRQKAARGSFRTAVKMGRDWFIEENEPYLDNRIKTGKHIGARRVKPKE